MRKASNYTWRQRRKRLTWLINCTLRVMCGLPCPAVIMLFYAATALLASRGLAYSKHAGLISGFGEHFAKPRILDPKLHEWLRRAFDLRSTADYALDAILTDSKIREQLARTREFVQTIRDYLTTHQTLGEEGT